MKQEKTKQAIYLIIDNGHPTAVKNFIAFYNNLSKGIKGKNSYLIIDAEIKGAILCYTTVFTNKSSITL